MLTFVCWMLAWLLLSTALEFARAGAMPFGARLRVAIGAVGRSLKSLPCDIPYGMCLFVLAAVGLVVSVLEWVMCLFVMIAGLVAATDEERLQLLRMWARYLNR